jgi:hypothetical protein
MADLKITIGMLVVDHALDAHDYVEAKRGI